MPDYCPNCGAEQIESSKFCSACGKKIKQKPETKKKTQPQQEEPPQTSIQKSTTQKSRKKLILGITAIIVIIILAVIITLYLQGSANPFNSSDSRFIGEWEQNIVGGSLLWKFNDDGTLENESSSGQMNNVGTWAVKNSQLCLHNNTRCYTFEFSNNGSTLTMKRPGENIVLTKKDQQGANQTPNTTCISNSTTNRLIIMSIDENVKWSDIEITTDPVASWQIQDMNKNQLAKIGTTTTIVRYVTNGDNILLLETVGDIAVTLKYIPTNAILGTWRVNV